MSVLADFEMTEKEKDFLVRQTYGTKYLQAGSQIHDSGSGDSREGEEREAAG